jgi:SAM-dependent methyltransferase
VTVDSRADRPAGQPDPDDWDYHWEVYGEAAQTNPANRYRRRLILDLLGRPRTGSTVLDIGSGQGEFAIHLADSYPDLTVWGVENSASGVLRARKAAAGQGVDVHFAQQDLLRPVTPEADQPLADYAVCSEVLEHVPDPVVLMGNATSLLAPGCRVVVTVPGGPRSAFDRHIGHYQHFTAPKLHAVLTDAGLTVDRVLRAGVPFFNLYKLSVIARGKRLIADVQNRAPQAAPGRLERAVVGFFNAGFKLNRDDCPGGWQLAAVAHVPPGGRGGPA